MNEAQNKGGKEGEEYPFSKVGDRSGTLPGDELGGRAGLMKIGFDELFLLQGG